MRRSARLAVVLTAISIAAVGVASCGSTPPPEPDPSPSAVATSPTTTTDSPAVPPTSGPQRGGDHQGFSVAAPQTGNSAAAVSSVAQNFVVGYGEFSPFAFDPAREWFDRWQTFATPEFIGARQTGLYRLWEWTWRQQVKAFDVHVDRQPSITITGDTATVTVRANRLILGINDTADEARQQNLVFTLTMELRGNGNLAQVTEATQTDVVR